MPRKKSRPKLKYGRAMILVLLLASFILVGAGFGFVVGAVRNMPKYDLENITGDLSSTVIDKDNQVVANLRNEKNRVALEPNEIPQVMKNAIVAIEDRRFYKHFGVDPIRIGGAVLANFTKGYGAEGGSTITQQLVKQAILENPEKTMRRKIQEAIIALQVESKYSKEQILALYLNNVYYGHSAWSLQTASTIYFGKDAQEIDLAEAAMLAGVVNRPGTYSPYINMEKATQRQAVVLDRMVEMKSITKEEAATAKAEPLKLVSLKPNDYQYQSYLDYVVDEAATALNLDNSEITNLYTSGYKIYTTMDSKTQVAAEQVYANDKNFPADKKDKIVQSAMVVLDPHSGEIWTLIGGRNVQGQRQFNRAVAAYRQPGSAFKPVAVYGPALEMGYSPATVIDDYPEEYPTPSGPKTFVNYDNSYRGLISMRTAIQYSVNTAAVKMLERIGVNEGFKFAKKLGVSTLVESGNANDMGLSLGLGGLTKGVSPLELTAAYGVFANQGVYIKPHAIRKIEDREGNVLYEYKPVKSVLISPQTAYLMNDMLQTVVQAGTGTRAKLDRPVAGKTGTTSFDVDAWFVGYTPDLVSSVWLGYDQVEAMRNVSGGSTGAPIWSQVMKVAHQGLPVSSFPQPEGIVSIPVDYKSGLLPSALTPAQFITTENFNSNFVPVEVSNVWVEQVVCAETGELLTSNCPTPLSKVFLKRPAPWTGSIAPEDAYLELPTQYCTLHGGNQSSNGLRLQGSRQVDGNNNLIGIRLTWYNPTNNPISAYQVYRSTQPNVPLSPANKVAELNAQSTNWQDSNVQEDSKYYYRVVAVSAGQTASSNEIIVQKPTQSTSSLRQPHLSGEVNVTANKAKINLTWSAAAIDQPLIYYVFRSETPNFEPSTDNQLAVDQVITATSWTDTGVSRKKTYYYRVIAFNMETNRQSPLSNQLSVQTK